MLTLIDWILDLFRNEDTARAFVTAPEQAMRDAGLAGATAAQVSAVAATAVPGLVLGGADPIVGLQRAVSNQYGFAPAYQPSFEPVYAPAPTFAPETTTDLASHNDTSLLSPNQDAGANAQQGGLNIGFGDITLGSKTTNTASNGGVVVDGDSGGDIVSGDGAVLGNDNDVNNGDVWAQTGSDVAVGHGDVDDSGTTATGGSSVIKDNGGPVFHDVDASAGNGGGSAGGDSLIDVGIGSGGTSGGNAGGGGITIVSDDTSTETVAGDQTHVGGDSDSGNAATSTAVAHQNTVTDSSTELNSHLDPGHDTSLVSSGHLLGL